MARRIAIYRYKYRNPPATQTTSPPPYSPTLPLPPMSSTCEYLESPQDITEPGITKIVVRERGGPTDNHVQCSFSPELSRLPPLSRTRTLPRI